MSTIGHAEFLDEIEDESGLAIAFAVIQAEVWIETDIEAHALDFVVEDAVAVIEHAVVFVAALRDAAGEFAELLRRQAK